MSANPVGLKTLIPPPYKQEFPLSTRVKGGVALALAALAIVGYTVFLTQHTITPMSLTQGVGITTLLVGGGAFIIYRVKKRDPRALLNPELKPAVQDKNELPIYIVQGEDKFYFQAKAPDEHYTVSSVVALGTPFVMIGSIVYHTLRMCVVPFYILGCLAVEQFSIWPLYPEQGRFKLVDVVLEPWRSLKQIVKAPFYATAFFMCALYSFVDPIGGRLLGGAVERDWNEGHPLGEGFWSIGGRMRNWSNKPGPFGYYLAGCWQPGGEITESGAVDFVGKKRTILE